MLPPSSRRLRWKWRKRKVGIRTSGHDLDRAGGSPYPGMCRVSRWPCSPGWAFCERFSFPASMPGDGTISQSPAPPFSSHRLFARVGDTADARQGNLQGPGGGGETDADLSAHRPVEHGGPRRDPGRSHRNHREVFSFQCRGQMGTRPTATPPSAGISACGNPGPATASPTTPFSPPPVRPPAPSTAFTGKAIPSVSVGSFEEPQISHGFRFGKIAIPQALAVDHLRQGKHSRCPQTAHPTATEGAFQIRIRGADSPPWRMPICLAISYDYHPNTRPYCESPWHRMVDVRKMCLPTCRCRLNGGDVVRGFPSSGGRARLAS